MNRIPLWIKLAYTAWMVVWVPMIWRNPGPANFLWFCDIANFVLLVALWRESGLLASSQAVGVLAIQMIWNVDFFSALLTGQHVLGGTEYMFDAARPVLVRSLSLFHVWVPLLLLWVVWRLGYDRAGWKLQTLLAWLILPVCFVFTDPERNLNWLAKPFGMEPSVPPVAILLAAMVAVPVVLYWPTHRLLLRWAPTKQAAAR